MLKNIRTILAAVVFAGITLLFMGIGHDWWGWLAKLQFLPALFRLTAGAIGMNLLVVAGILLLTFIFGRIYCSVICPLGIMQDLVLWIRRKIYPLFHKNPKTGKGRKFSLEFTTENRMLRYSVFALYVICIIAGIQVLIAFLAPYSAYGRMIRSLASLWVTGAYEGPAAVQTMSLSVIAIVTFAVITVIAAVSGRGWCNSICPVGTFLSFFSRFSLFRPVIDKDACTGCRSCEKKCRARCIDVASRSIDYSRCVDCFECIDSCPKHGLKYKFVKPGTMATASCAPCKPASGPVMASDSSEKQAPSEGRRAFIQGAVLAIGAAAVGEVNSFAQDVKLDGGFADVQPKKNPERAEKVVPFGARGVKNFYSKCTACQLCVAACPNGVLRPSTDLKHLMQPEMGFESGYCRPECTACSQVCPAGAILPVTKEEKTAIHIGLATVNLDLCVVRRDNVDCGNCSRHCPAGAIVMVRDEKTGKRIPTVNESQCIGCGACENLCPSRPISAIHVDGLNRHITKA